MGAAMADLRKAGWQGERTLPKRIVRPLPQAGPTAWQAAGAAARQPLPLVVFSHGLGGSRFGYSHLGRHWAAQGYASLHLQHPGSDRAVWTSGFFSLLSNLQSAASDANAIARARDVSFGITALLAEPAFAARIDPAQIAVAGHSYGANTALLVAGARILREVDGEWRTLSYRDPRVKAAVLLSTPPFYGENSPQAILAPVTLPTLHVTCAEDIIRIPGYYSPPEDRIAMFDAIGSAHKTLAVFQGGSHSVFTDRAGTGGATLNPQVKAATQGLSLAFLQSVFDGDTEALPAWARRWDDIVMRFVEKRAEPAPQRPALTTA
jgi:predicted dienelactone hydrolase